MKKFLLSLSLLLGLFQARGQWVVQANKFPNPGLAVLSIKAVDANVAWVLGIDSSLTAPTRDFSRTTNGGTTWTAGKVGTFFSFGLQGIAITALDGNTAWVGGTDFLTGSDGKIFRTTNGGTTWTEQANNFFAAPNFPRSIHFFNASNGVAIGNHAGGYFEIITTTNGGSSWTRVARTAVLDTLPNENANFSFYSNGNNVWFGTSAGRIFRSTNMGVTWAASQSGLQDVDAIAFRDNQNGIAKMGTALRRTTNGGMTWTPVSTTGKVHFLGFDYVPGTPATYVSVGGGIAAADAGSSYSYDDGVTWVPIESTLHHTALDMVSPTAGWSGGYNTSSTVGGVHKWTGNFICTTTSGGLSTSAYCSNSAPVTLTGSPAGGTFSGPGVSGNTFNPALAGPGTAQIKYTVALPNGCNGITTQTASVVQAPVSAFTYSSSGSVYNFTTQATNVATYSWSFPGGSPATSGVANPSVTYASPGNYQVTLSTTGTNGCSSTSTQNLSIVTGRAEDRTANFRLYPNPANGNITIDLTGLPATNCFAEVYTVQGKLCRTFSIKGGTLNPIPTNDLPEGAYMVKLSGTAKNIIMPLIIRK